MFIEGWACNVQSVVLWLAVTIVTPLTVNNKHTFLHTKKNIGSSPVSNPKPLLYLPTRFTASPSELTYNGYLILRRWPGVGIKMIKCMCIFILFYLFIYLFIYCIFLRSSVSVWKWLRTSKLKHEGGPTYLRTYIPVTPVTKIQVLWNVGPSFLKKKRFLSPARTSSPRNAGPIGPTFLGM